MPAPLRVDWDSARLMFVGGASLIDISTQTGISYDALKQRAYRYKWNDEIKAHSLRVTKAVTKATLAVTEKDTRDILRQGDAWKARIIGLTERHLRAVESKEPEELDLEDFEKLTRITDTTDKIARRSFGLDVPQNQTAHLMVHVQSDLAAGSSGSSGTVKQLPAGDVIDVESKPVLSSGVAPRE